MGAKFSIHNETQTIFTVSLIRRRKDKVYVIKDPQPLICGEISCGEQKIMKLYSFFFFFLNLRYKRMCFSRIMEENL